VHPLMWVVFDTLLANFRETPNSRTSENSVMAKFAACPFYDVE
jgi:hypothetical protein